MITSDEIKSFQLGDNFVCGKMFPGLCPDMVVWDVIEKGKDYIICTVTYLGALLGSYKLLEKGAGVIGKEES